MMKSRDDRGLSIVELIVVIAIMAVMLGVIGYSLNMLFGAEARQGARKMDAQLNDIKTGAMSRASEYMILRYIEVDPSNAAAYAKVGVDKSGYYAEKHIASITNNDTRGGGSIKFDYGGEEYTRIGSKKVEISLNDGTVILDNTGISGSNAFMIEYERSTGILKKLNVGTVSYTGDVSADFTGGSEYDLDKLTFTSGLKSYDIVFDRGTGKHTIE